MAQHVLLYSGGSYSITTDMTGKMRGMLSLNTSPQCNPFCQKMQKDDSNVCTYCYSAKTEKRWTTTQRAWINNFNMLSKIKLKRFEIPTLTCSIFRFSAHGELANRCHYNNLCAIAKANTQTIFALWTKRLDVINRGGVCKLDNLIHVYSTPKLDVLNPTLPPGFDKVFSVYTPEFAEKHNIKINCGAKKCAECRLCYTHNKTTYVNELLK